MKWSMASCEYYIKTVWRDIIVIVGGYYILIIASCLNSFSWGLVWFKICLLPRPFFSFSFFLRSVWSFHFNFFLHQTQYPSSLIYPLRTVIWILGLAAFCQLWIIRGWVLISSFLFPLCSNNSPFLGLSCKGGEGLISPLNIKHPLSVASKEKRRRHYECSW
jgi:hypothetical protein